MFFVIVSPPPSSLDADIVFIIDASRGMPFDQYRGERNFIVSLAR